MNTITAVELKKKLDNADNIKIIDIREDYEFEDYNINGVNIPLDTILHSIDSLDKTNPVIFICKSGKRSKALVHTLKRKHDLSNFYSLEGGILNYQEEIGS